MTKLTMNIKTLDDYVPMFDKLRVNQIAFNLLSNAVKYTPEGGKITFSAEDKVTADGRMHVIVIVSDTESE